MMQVFQRLRRWARYLALCLLAAAPASALASSPAGPGGINIGIDFNWSQSGPPGYAAAFINAPPAPSGSVTTCTQAASTTPTSTACDFPIAYSIGGTPQTAVVAGGAYNTWGQTGPSNARFCDGTPSMEDNTAPLTLWNCFNSDSFGQIFIASATGALSNMTMPMTCLNPAGGTLPAGGFFAVIYQLNTVSGGIPQFSTAIPPTALAQVPVDLSTCPTLTTWNGHTFSPGDFAEIPLNFQNVTLTSGNFYGVFFTGTDVPGVPLPGFAPPAPTLTEWSAIALAAAFVALGLWKLRRRSAA